MPIRQFEITGIKHKVYPMKSLALRIIYEDGTVHYQYLAHTMFSEPIPHLLSGQRSERTLTSDVKLVEQICSMFSFSVHRLSSSTFLGQGHDISSDILSGLLEETHMQRIACALLYCKSVAVVNAIQITHN